MTSRRRLLLACGLFSSWMVLLMTGFVLGGALHLLLVLALVVLPWREVPPGEP